MTGRMVTEPRSDPKAMATHIARAAARLFAERGYDATPVREIVAAAGVTKPTLYYHFGSKEALGQALFTDPMTRLVQGMRQILDNSADPAAALIELLQANFNFGREDPDRTRFIFALFFGPLASGLAVEMARFSQELDELWLAAARQLAAAGAIDPARAGDFEVAVRGLLISHMMNFLFRGCELAPDLARRIVADLLDGFRPARPEGGA